MNKPTQTLNQNITSLVNNEKFAVQKQSTLFYRTQDMDNVPPCLNGLYSNAEKVQIYWNFSHHDEEYGLDGRINILEIEHVLSDWKDTVWFEYNDESDPIRQFKVIDYFSDEGFVGFYNIEGMEDCLYHLELGRDPQSLALSINGYIELLAQTRGFFYWQRVLLHIQSGIEYPEVARFKKYMPQLFENFNYNDFVERYKSLQVVPEKTPKIFVY